MQSKRNHQDNINESLSSLSSGLIAINSNDSNGDNLADLKRKPAKRRAQVVIIGSGLAGLAAAQRLSDAGVNDVIILEALDRIGGRVHTIKHRDYLLELGAQWLHGADDNPLYKWLSGDDMQMLDDFEDASFGFKGKFCTNLGAQINEQLVSKVLDIVNNSKLALSKDENYLKNIELSNGNQLDVERNNCKLRSASSVFRLQLELAIEQDAELAKNSQLVYSLFDWFLRYETIENCCDTMDDVSIESYTNWTDSGDGTLLNFKNGYASLLHWFCNQFPVHSWLRLNKQVLNVKLLPAATCSNNNNSNDNDCCWLEAASNGGGGRNLHKGPILIRYKSTTTNNDNGDDEDEDDNVEQTIECDHVIVSVSLGFLKNNMDTFFEPALPDCKRNLISSIGFGTVNKIVLQFEQPFWQPNCAGIKLVWLDNNNTDNNQCKFPIWVRDIVAFDVVRKQPNLLLGWIGGQGAKLIELESKETIGTTCLQVLDAFLPSNHPRPTRLIACLCSRWNSNPFTCGSYSYQSMSSFNMNLDKLHEPMYDRTPVTSVNDQKVSCEVANCLSQGKSTSSASSSRVATIPRILFAGEATAGKLYSTAHGAIVSGWREADRLTDHLLSQLQLDKTKIVAKQQLTIQSTAATTPVHGECRMVSLSS